MSHPSPVNLMRYAFKDPMADATAVALHLHDCPACAEEVGRLLATGAQLRGVSGNGDPASDHLDDDTIAAVADGEIDAEHRALALRHIARCASCRASVASVANAIADSAIAREAAGPRNARRWLRGVAVPLAAAALLLVIVRLPQRTEDASPHRAPVITAVSAPVPLAPMGAVADVEALRWSSAGGAERYRVTLFDTSGRVMYEEQLVDTLLLLPDTLGLEPGRRYLWKVEARSDFDRWSTSTLVEFSVVSGVRR